MTDDLEKRVDYIADEIKRAYEERKELYASLSKMRDRSSERVEAIMDKVSEKAESVHKDLMDKVAGMAEGVTMKVFMWTMRVVVVVLVGYGSWLLAMHSGMKDLGTNVQLIQKDMEYTKEAIVKIEKLMNHNVTRGKYE